MTHAEAEREAAKLAEQHPERDNHAWFAKRDATGEWSVVKVRVPTGSRRIPGKATVEAKPKPPQADDPRPAMWRDVGGPYGGG